MFIFCHPNFKGTCTNKENLYICINTKGCTHDEIRSHDIFVQLFYVLFALIVFNIFINFV